EHRDQVQPEVEERGQHGGERDGQPRELDLAHEVLALDERADRPARGLREEAEEDDAQQQRDRVEAHAAAEVEDLREDDVEDAEEHQRPDQLPQVAEDRAEEAQAEVGDRDRPGQLAQAARIAAQRRRALDRPSEALGDDRRRAHRRAFSVERVTSISKGSTTMPLVCAVAVTMKETYWSRRSRVSLPSPGRATASVTK